MSTNESDCTLGRWVMTILTVLFVSLFFCPALRVQAEAPQSASVGSVEDLYIYMVAHPEQHPSVKIDPTRSFIVNDSGDRKASPGMELMLYAESTATFGRIMIPYALSESRADPILARLMRLHSRATLTLHLRPDAAHLVEHKAHDSFPPAERLFELTNAGGDVL